MEVCFIEHTGATIWHPRLVGEHVQVLAVGEDVHPAIIIVCMCSLKSRLLRYSIDSLK